MERTDQPGLEKEGSAILQINLHARILYFSQINIYIKCKLVCHFMSKLGD